MCKRCHHGTFLGSFQLALLIKIYLPIENINRCVKKVIPLPGKSSYGSDSRKITRAITQVILDFLFQICRLFVNEEQTASKKKIQPRLKNSKVLNIFLIALNLQYRTGNVWLFRRILGISEENS